MTNPEPLTPEDAIDVLVALLPGTLGQDRAILAAAENIATVADRAARQAPDRDGITTLGEQRAYQQGYDAGRHEATAPAMELEARQAPDTSAEVIDRLTRALRVATHKPHDHNGKPNEGFPTCSVCGAIQTQSAPEPLTPEELGDLLVLYDRASLPQRNLILDAEREARQAPDTSGLREAAQAVVQLAETDDNWEGEYMDYLVPAGAIGALRAALAATETP